MSTESPKDIPFLEPTVDQEASNTRIVDSGQVSSTQVLPTTQLSSVSAEGVNCDAVDELTERWFKLGDFQWSSVDPFDRVLFEASFPKAILENLDAPNLVFLRSYAYFQADIEIKIMVSGNRFQNGCALCYWKYMHGPDVENARCYIAYNNVQAPHSFISIAANNTAILTIPYKFVNPYVATGNFSFHGAKNLYNFAYMAIQVYNPLQSTSTSYNAVEGTVYARLNNFRGHGMIPLTLREAVADHQMLSIAGAALEAGLKQAMKDFNRDKPSDPTAHMTMVPYSSHSWANGTNVVEKLNILRLDPTATTPHPNSYVNDEMQCKYITRTWGCNVVTKWSQSETRGSLIWNCPVCPLSGMSLYFTNREAKNDNLATYIVPPIGVMASLYQLWNGTIDYRFDIVKTMMHTGRLIVAFIPGVSGKFPHKNKKGEWKNEYPTLGEMAASYHAVFDMGGDATSFTFSVPYVAQQPWMPVSDYGNTQTPRVSVSTGTIFLSVLNRMVPMDSVPTSIPINIFVRGGEDFELSVPVRPMLGVGFNRKFIRSASTIYVSPGYYPVYAGTWRRWYKSDKYYAILRYGTGSDHVAQIAGDSPVQQMVYQSKDPVVVNNMGSLVDCRYFVIPYRTEDWIAGYRYLVPFKTLSGAQTYAKARDSDGRSSVIGGLEITVDGPWGWNDGQTLTLVGSPSSFEMVEFQNGEENPRSAPPATISKVTSETSFNESFSDLKSLCRRFQIYAEIATTLNSSYAYASVFVNVPLYPGGLRLDDRVGRNVMDVTNFVRDGTIPLIASGFAYYRGGMRLKVVVSSPDIEDGVFMMSHIPDMILEPTVQYVSPIHENATFVAGGYASYVQSIKCNEVFELEIPYYQPHDYGSIPKYRKDASPYMRASNSLGVLSISTLCRVPKETKINIQVFYALADDMRFSSFQGFPDMVDPFAVPAVRPMIDYEAAEHQMGIMNKIRGTVDNEVERVAVNLADELAPKMEEMGTNLLLRAEIVGHSLLDAASDKMMLAYDTLMRLLTKLGDSMKDVMKSAVTQLIHMFVNPSIKTAIVCITGFVIQIGVFPVECFRQIMTAYNKAVNKVLGKDESGAPIQQQTNGAENEAEHQLGEVEVCALSATCLTAFAAAIGLTLPSTKTTPSFFSSILSGMRNFSMTANSMTIFIRNNIKAFMSMIEWVIHKCFPAYEFSLDMSSYETEINQWAIECAALTDVAMINVIRTDPRLQQQVFVCAIKARDLMTKMTKSPEQVSLIRILSGKIFKLQEELASSCLSPAARFEPFVLHLTGESKIGKSYLCQSVGIDMLKSINYRTYADPIFTDPSGSDYKNGLTNQPIILIDDFAAFQSESKDCFRDLLALKSSAVYNPNIAEVENKKIRCNPLIVLLNSNRDFWTPPSEICMDAVHRRRDLLWKIELTPEFVGKDIGKIDPDKLRNFEHLQFARHSNPKVNDQRLYSDWMNYDQFLGEVKKEFGAYYPREMGLYKKRLHDLSALFPDSDESSFGSLTERLKYYEDICLRSGTTTSDIRDFKKRIHQLVDPTLTTVRGIRTLDEDKAFLDALVNEADHEMGKVNYESIPLVDINRPSTSSYRSRYLEDQLVIERPILTEQTLTKFSECPHTDLDSSFQLDDDDESIMRDPCGSHNKIIPVKLCKENCFLNTEEGKNLVRYWVWSVYHAEMEFVTMTAGMIPPFAIPSFDELYPGKRGFETPCGVIKLSWPAKLRARWEKFLAEEKIGKIWSVLKKVFKWLAIAVGVIGIGALGYQCVSKESTEPTQDVTPDPWHPPEHQVFVSGDVRTIGKEKGGRIAKRSFKYGEHQIGATQNPFPATNLAESKNHVTNLVQLLHRNMAEVSFETPEKKYYQRVLGFEGSNAITTKHFYETFVAVQKLHPECRIKITRDKATVYKSLRECNFLVAPQSSIAVVTLPGIQFKNIKQHFADDWDHEICVRDGLFCTFTSGIINTKSIHLNIHKSLRIREDGPASGQFLEDVYSYNVCERGLCGSPILAIGNVPRIIGIHVAGNPKTNTGYAEPLFRSNFSNLRTVTSVELPVDHQMLQTKPLIDIESSVYKVGTIPRCMMVHQPSETKIVPSLMHDQIVEVLTEPAPLSGRDERLPPGSPSPLKSGVEKHGNPPLPFDLDILDECINSLSDKINTVCRPVLVKHKELLTDEEIFSGIPGSDYYRHLELTTSEGYPLVLERPNKAKDKRWLFDYNDAVDGQGRKLKGIHRELKDLLAYNHNLRQMGVIPNTVFYDCLKDARLPKEKVSEPGKTRVFSVCPLEFTWTSKKYYGHFQAAFSHARFESECAIGINVNSLEWSRLYRYLMSKGNNIITGDYKAFGDRLYQQAMYGAFKIINKWYEAHFSDRFTPYRDMLAHEAVMAQRMALNVVYRVFCGIPSGFPLTVEINNLVNQLYMRYCWRVASGLTLRDFDRYVALCCYGDDLIMSVHSSVLDRFNFFTIEKVLRDLNIGFTPGEKESTPRKCISIEEATFLKAKFVNHPTYNSVKLAKLPLASATDCLNWNWKTSDPVDATYEASRACLNGCFGHGPVVYNSVRKKILDWYGTQDPNKFGYCHLPTWQEENLRIFEDCT